LNEVDFWTTLCLAACDNCSVWQSTEFANALQAQPDIICICYDASKSVVYIVSWASIQS